MKILVATGNPKKIRELRAALEPFGAQLVEPADVGELPDVVEDELTFAGNAKKKARSAALATGLWSLADDSGLEVDRLRGAPGVHSARFAGPGADDERNNDLLLEKLAGVPESERTARFTCALALCRPDGTVALETSGTARGRILLQRRGTRDFGYDPLFLFTEEGFPQTGKTFAEIPLEQKSAVSHRGRALRALAAELPALLARV